VDAPKEIDAATLTEALLEYAFSPAGPEVQRERSYRYLEELLFLKLFSVDYVLGIRGASQAEFTPVRMLYNEGIERSSSVKGFDYRTITSQRNENERGDSGILERHFLASHPTPNRGCQMLLT
jgi:hypothetical protein